jgi:hypothetical protein
MGPKITHIYVMMLNGNSTRLSLKDEILDMDGCVVELHEVPNAISRGKTLRIKTKATEFENEEEMEAAETGDSWKVGDTPTYTAYETIFARGVGNCIAVTDEHATVEEDEDA